MSLLCPMHGGRRVEPVDLGPGGVAVLGDPPSRIEPGDGETCFACAVEFRQLWFAVIKALGS